MALNIPKPLFVIGDTLSSSHVTTFQIFNSDNLDYLICGTNDGDISVWSLTTYRCLYRTNLCLFADELEENLRRINSIFVVFSNQQLLIHAKSGDIFLFKINFGNFEEPEMQLINRWNSQQTTFAKCALIKNEYLLFLSPNDPKQICVINLESILYNKCLVDLVNVDNTEHGMVMAIYAFFHNVPQIGLPNQPKQLLYFVVAYEDGIVLLYQVSLFEKLEEIFKQSKIIQNFETVQIAIYQSHPEMITCLDFNVQMMRGICCSVNNEISIWDLNLPEKLIEHDSVDITVWKSKIASLYQQGKLGFCEQKNKRIKILNAGILCCSIRDDGRIFATGGKDGRIRVFALRSGKPLAILPLHTNSIEHVGFFRTSVHDDSTTNTSSNNQSLSLFIASSREKSISIWSLYNN